MMSRPGRSNDKRIAMSVKHGYENPRRNPDRDMGASLHLLGVFPALPILAPRSALRNRASQHFHHFLDIGPHQAFVTRVAQQVRRMECRHHPRPTHLMPYAAQFAYRGFDLEQCLYGEGSEADDDARLDYVDLPEQERLARRDFVQLGIAIFRRPALDDVADVDLGPRHSHAALDDIGQELPGASYERLAARVFVGARRLAHEHQLRVRIADAENEIRSPGRQLAALAIADKFAQLFEV